MRNCFFMTLGMLTCLFGEGTQPLVVSYATSHLSGVPDAVVGMLITPSGEYLKTDPMGPFDHCNLVVNSPEAGSYQVYFEVLSLGSFRLCPIVGGVAAILLDHPEKSIAVTPRESRIQTFPAGKHIQIGSVSGPICGFQLTGEDLE